MADTNIANVLSLVATTSSKVKDLIIKDGQLIFVRDMGRIAFDFKGQRVFYNQIVELKTDLERTTMDSPISGYYFVINTGVLWFYKKDDEKGEWIQITERPEEVIFIGVELPELGQANKLYVDTDDREISVWIEEANQYLTVSNFTEEVSDQDIEALFN